jgi:NAD(P)-dependent dehydrogenase (short-subunit alcohol dehydrogenase family)
VTGQHLPYSGFPFRYRPAVTAIPLPSRAPALAGQRPPPAAGSTGITAVAAAEGVGRPGLLVNCAGINLRPPLPELSDGQWDETMAVNPTAPFLPGQRFGPGTAPRTLVRRNG